MSPRTRIWNVGRALAIRSRPVRTRPESFAVSFQRQHFADSAGSKASGSAAPKDFKDRYGGFDPASEGKGTGEATESEQIMEVETTSSDSVAADGKPLPDHFETMFDKANLQGVRNVLGDGEALEGGLTIEQEQALYEEGVIPPTSSGNPAVDQLAEIATGLKPRKKDAGHKWPLPPRRLPWHMQMRNRYHPVLMQLSRLLMSDGKLSKAQFHLAQVLTYLRTSPPPILSPKYPLLPGAPPAQHLPLNPVMYLTLAIDSVAPLMRIRYLSGLAGGGAKLEMPIPLEVRQRRRIAFKWILDVVSKKPSMGSGKLQFAHRLASEIIAVAEGRSAVWEKRQQLHSIATGARANLKSLGRRPTKRLGGK